MVSAQRVSPTGPGALSVGRQAFPPTVSKELHNVIWNSVAEAWVAKRHNKS